MKVCPDRYEANEPFIRQTYEATVDMVKRWSFGNYKEIDRFEGPQVLKEWYGEDDQHRSGYPFLLKEGHILLGPYNGVTIALGKVRIYANHAASMRLAVAVMPPEFVRQTPGIEPTERLTSANILSSFVPEIAYFQMFNEPGVGLTATTSVSILMERLRAFDPLALQGRRGLEEWKRQIGIAMLGVRTSLIHIF